MRGSYHALSCRATRVHLTGGAVAATHLSMNIETLLERIQYMVPLIFSLSVHEWAHAYSAFRLGDDTASLQGRMTLNPVAHIDLFGTILLPLLGVPFGWAKPVPINPARFTRRLNMGAGMALTAAAGPASNILLALLSGLAYVLCARLAPEFFFGENALRTFLQMMMPLNVLLAVFNMVPLPPLDGSRFVDWLLPKRLEPFWGAVRLAAPALLLALLFFGRGLYMAPFNAIYGWLVGSVNALLG